MDIADNDTIGVEQIDARTWLSSAERALLDVACFSLSRCALDMILQHRYLASQPSNRTEKALLTVLVAHGHLNTN